MQALELDIFSAFEKDWALLTAGTPEHFNTMTISWGGLGTLWGKSVATVYVRPSRYTWQFMENSDYFTVSFYPEACRKALTTLGTLSGRDGDKVAKTDLTPVPAGECVTFAQAHTTVLCRKLYAQDMEPAALDTQLREKIYGDEPLHRMYIGEVIKILR